MWVREAAARIRRFAGDGAVTEGVFSFHRMRAACLAGDPAGWHQALATYAPLARQLLGHYFPGLDAAALLTQVFREAKADQARLWRTFAGTSEKEFLLHFRRFLLEQGRVARGAPPETPLTPESFRALLEPFPPLQREMLVLSFHRYTPEELSAMMKFQAQTTRAAVEQARELLRTQLGAAVGPEVAQGDHDALFAALEEQRGKACVPDKTYVRIVDGQITWRDREEVDRHIADCLYCLNRFAEFREVHHFFHTLPPAGEAEVAGLAAALGLPAEAGAGKGKTWWQRLLGG